MEGILTKAFAFAVFVVIGALARKFKVLDEKERQFIARLVLNVTLPSALASSLSSLTLDPSFLILLFLGMGVNVVFLLAGWINSRKLDRPDRIFSMMCTPGFSVVIFVLPYAQSFMGPEATLSVSLFEVGNGLMVLGVTGAIVTAILGHKSDQGRLRQMAGQLVSSIPVLVSVLMLTLSLLRLGLPSPIKATVDLVAASNSFLSMLMLGTLIDLSLIKKHLKVISRVLLMRYFLSTLIAAAIYLWLPVPQIVRYTMILSLFSPITSISALFAERLGGSKEVAGLAISVSIVNSTVITIGILILAGEYMAPLAGAI